MQGLWPNSECFGANFKFENSIVSISYCTICFCGNIIYSTVFQNLCVKTPFDSSKVCHFRLVIEKVEKEYVFMSVTMM